MQKQVITRQFIIIFKLLNTIQKKSPENFLNFFNNRQSSILQSYLSHFCHSQVNHNFIQLLFQLCGF